jgi:bifunctional non-homologous end joining protein LigD
MFVVLQPMLASLEDAPLDDPALVYEPKYDGIRAIVEVAPGGKGVRLWSRLGNDKTSQFPEIVAALERWGRRRRESVVIDGEIVALDERGEPAGFQNLQGRIHLKEIAPRPREARSRASSLSRRSSPSGPSSPSSPSRPSSPSSPSVALIAFDILRDGDTDLRDRPLTERRAILERLFGKTGTPLLRISEQVRGDGSALYKRAVASGWEGLIAKRGASRYLSGKRTSDWRKLKIHQEQEFVIGGWTEPRQSRAYFGALLLGVYEADSSHSKATTQNGLTYVGHVGTGFNERELARLMRAMKPIEIESSPFNGKVPTNERPHWVQPTLVAQVRFSEWTADGILRHPVYLGLRDDKNAETVTRELKKKTTANLKVRTTTAAKPATVRLKPDTTSLLDQLRALEASRRDGLVELPDGDRLRVTNLHKVFWPALKLTKGDLFRYYVEVAPALLPVIADRPLVMKRFPNGVDAAPFYQHRAEEAPEGVRIETVKVAGQRPQIIGGSLKTLLYTTQLAAISQDPWFSRVPSLDDADFVALDLDPSTGATFARVLDVARWIHDELETLGAPGFPKTSGSEGLHIYVPLPPGTSYEAGLLFAQIIATVVAQKHPKEATVERTVSARGNRVYIDCLQNILGKTLASAYSARASEYAGVSTPLSWKEVDRGVRREDFTIQTVPARVAKVGDLWAGLAKSKGVDLTRVSRYTSKR